LRFRLTMDFVVFSSKIYFTMLNYNEITQRKYIDLDGEPYEVITSQVSRKQANKPVNKTKIKSLISGRVIEKVFHVSDKAKEADIGTRTIKYLYNNRGEYWFSDPENPKDRFKLDENVLEDNTRYLKENASVDSLVFNDQIMNIKIPIKMDFTVKEAAPAVKGNTATGATKQITLETGMTVNTPLFINEGDIIRINTETGEYTERVEKK